MNIHKYTDTWGGTNYGCYPKITPGKNLIERLDRSLLWEKSEHTERVDERNDNQVDIHRGSDFVYFHKDGEKTIRIVMNRSRSGKTVKWEFHCNFYDSIEI